MLLPPDFNALPLAKPAVMMQAEARLEANLSTGDQVNFGRSDPPLLWRRCDGLAVALLAVFAAAAALAGWPRLALAALPATVVHAPALVVARLLVRWKLAREVDDALDIAVRQATYQPALRRVKQAGG